MSYEDLTKRLLRMPLKEAEVINFVDRLNKMGHSGQDKARQIHNRTVQNDGVHPGAEKSPLTFADVYPKLKKHPWVIWLADAMVERYVSPFYMGYDGLEWPEEPEDLPDNINNAVSNMQLFHEWNTVLASQLVVKYINNADDPDMFAGFGDEETVELPSEEQIADIQKMVRKFIASNNVKALATIMSTHPEFGYCALARGGINFWNEISRISNHVAAQFVWTSVATPEQKELLSNAG